MKRYDLHSSKKCLFLTVLAFISFLFLANPDSAQTAITSASTIYESLGSSTANDYTTPGSGSVAGTGWPIGTNYDVKFRVGSNNNLKLNSVVVSGSTFMIDARNTSGTVSFQRKSNANIPNATSREIIYYEQESVSGTTINLKPEKISSMKAQLESEVINRGIDNIFLNGSGITDYNFNTIERIDKVWSTNLSTALISDYGFLILERGGNDAFQIAAITAIDGSNNPTAWGALVSVNNSTHWGNTGTTLVTNIFKNDQVALNNTAYNTATGITNSNTPDTYFEPTVQLTSQNLRGVFISYSDLGITSNSPIYGYSLFAADSPSNMTTSEITNINSETYYPSNTTVSALDFINGPLMFNYSTLDVNASRNSFWENNYSKNDNFRIFNNPVDKELKIQWNGKTEITKAEITSINTQLTKVIQFEDNNTYLVSDISDLPTGIYILKIQTNDAIEVKRFIKF
ncbi:MAG: Hemolysin, plasmid [Bacteroidota bacterium]|jgi:hypothetical protein